VSPARERGDAHAARRKDASKRTAHKFEPLDVEVCALVDRGPQHADHRRHEERRHFERHTTALQRQELGAAQRGVPVSRTAPLWRATGRGGASQEEEGADRCASRQ
jgi:hypothetical protein